MEFRRDWWKILLGLWLTGVIVDAFLYAPRAQDLGESTRILFFHVPCAWIATLAFLTSAVYSVLYLRKSDLNHDVWAQSSAHIGLIFSVLASVTGAVWANEIWGHPWNWDPRQTSIFILMLIYAAYFALRSAVEDDERRARLAAVYSIIAFVTVPFFMYIYPRIYDTLHPDPLINQSGKIQMNSKMQFVFFSSFAGFTLLYYWMLRIKVDVVRLTRKIEMRNLED